MRTGLFIAALMASMLLAHLKAMITGWERAEAGQPAAALIKESGA